MGVGASGMLAGILAIIGFFVPKKDQPSKFELRECLMAQPHLKRYLSIR